MIRSITTRSRSTNISTDDSSGTSPNARSGSCGSESLQAFQKWARVKGMKAFLGEFGGANNPTSLNALADICQKMSANSDVWLGWTAWAGGTWWPVDYMFNLGPAVDGGVREQTSILANHARPATSDYWVKRNAVIDLDLARGRVHGCTNMGAALEIGDPRAPHSPQSGPTRLLDPLRSLMRRPAFSLLVETEDLAEPVAEFEIVTLSSGPLLVRTADGAVRTAWGGGLQTNPQSLGNWRGRRRCIISLDKSLARVAIGVTGAGSLWRAGSPTMLADNELTAGFLHGRIIRVTGFDRYLDGEGNRHVYCVTSADRALSMCSTSNPQSHEFNIGQDLAGR